MSAAEVDPVAAYIEGQEEHHRVVSFQDGIGGFSRNTEWSMTNGMCGIEGGSPLQGS